MCVYDCNVILTAEMKNRSNKETIQAFTELTEYFKSRGINPGLNFIDNEASTALKMKIPTMDIKYQLVTPSNNREKNVERSIKIFKNHFIAVICNVDKDLHLQLWDILLHHATISINFLRQSKIIPYLPSPFHIKYKTTPRSHFFTKSCCGCCYRIIRRIENICRLE